MGVVYRARDPLINRLVALKTITASGADDQSLIQRFYREAQSAGGLQHPNIVTIYELGDEGGIAFIAMELIEGENLEQMISRRSPIPLPLKLVYAMQACSALDYAHKRGIVHRDIKPGNMMVNKEGAVKVVDFGIARVLETSKTQTGMLIGTFAYMSPEQYRGEHADERSDIWSFGVLLYELLCYQRPFSGATPAALMHGICSREAPPLRSVDSTLPAELETVMSRLLQKAPEDRYQSMEDLLLELDPICKSLQAESVVEIVAQSRELAEKGEYPRARDLLRQALQIDSKNAAARSLLEKVNAELRRAMVRPKAQKEVEKGKALLEQGNVREAGAAAEEALQLDSSFEPAQELQRLVQKELDRVQRLADWLDGAKQRLAEGLPEEAEALLAKVIESEPKNKQAKALLDQASREKAERKRHVEFVEKMQAARNLWTQQKYPECIQLLTELQKQHPEQEEISRLLQTAREDRAEQEKQQYLDKARNLLASRHYDECKLVLAELSAKFANDEEVANLIRDLQEDEANQRKLLRFAEARSLLSSRRFEECIALLSILQKEYPGENEVGKLLDAARREQLEERKELGLAKARKLRSSRHYNESKSALEDLRKQFPNDDEIPRLLQEIVEEQKEQRKQESLAEARKLLAARRYEDCTATLSALLKEFPGEADVEKLLKKAREEEAQQRRLQSLVEARNLLASRRFDESIVLLTQLQKTFPADEDIARLLETAHEELDEQRKQQKLGEARSLFVAERFQEAIALLNALGTAHPKDSAVLKLRAAVLQEQEKHAKDEKLKSDIAAVKKLVSDKKYPEILARAASLVAEYPGNADFVRLIEFARSQQAEIDRELAVRTALEEAKSLLKANRYDEAVRAVETGLKADPDNRELLAVREQAETQQKKFVTRREIEQRIREIKIKINREKLSEAIDLAKQTIATLGPDTDVTQLLNSAQVEIEARDRKRDQEKTIEGVRGLVQSGKFDEATRNLDAAVAAKLFDAFDSRAQRAAEEILAGREAAKRRPTPSAPPLPGDLTKEYAFQQGPPTIDMPPAPSVPAADAPGAQASAVQPTISAQPAPPPAAQPPQTKKPAQVSPPIVAEPSPPKKAVEPVKAVPPLRPAEPVKTPPPVVSVLPGRAAAPEPSVPAERLEYHEAPKRKPMLVAVGALGLVLAATAAYFLWPSKPAAKPPAVVANKPPAAKPVDPLEVKQREAMETAEKLVAANDLEKARQAVLDAEKLNGPHTSELQRMQSQIEDSLANKELRQLRQREAQLWQQASDGVTAKHYTQAESTLKQIQNLPDGGVHRDDARRYLTEVIPKLQRQDKLLSQARQSLRQGDFGAARQFASQLQQSGGDADQLSGDIDKTEADRLSQLEGQFNQFTQGDDDGAAQQLKALQPKFQALANNGGPKSPEAQNYLNRIPSSISDIQTRGQSKRLELAFQAAVQKYQQAFNGSDKNALNSARDTMQPFAQSGPHAGEAQKYVTDLNEKLNALNQPPPAKVTPPADTTSKSKPQPASPPVVKEEARSTAAPDEVAIRAVIQRFFEGFEQRNPDEMKQVWPSIPRKTYDKYKQSFEALSSVTIQVNGENVKMSSDGASATVSVQSQEEATPKNQKKSFKLTPSWTFQLARRNDVWMITDVQ
jgi:hypothetical protein